MEQGQMMEPRFPAKDFAGGKCDEIVEEEARKDMFASTATSRDSGNGVQEPSGKAANGNSLGVNTGHTSASRVHHAVQSEDIDAAAVMSHNEDRPSFETLRTSAQKEPDEHVGIGGATEVGQATSEPSIMGEGANSEHAVGVGGATEVGQATSEPSIMGEGANSEHAVRIGGATEVGQATSEPSIIGEGENSEHPVQAAKLADREDQNGLETMPKQLSKSALKQLAKRERYKEIKMERKAMEKEKRHQETARKRREWEEKLASLTEEERDKARLEKLNLRKERKEEQKCRRTRLVEALETGQNFVIDLEFSELMKPNELTSLIQQVMYSYSANGRATVPARLSLTGVKGDVQKELDKISGFPNWLVHKEERSYEEVFKERQSDLVYLTADSENVLETLDITKVYIIGGLVDRNRWKNVTFEKAKGQGIATAKLPVGEHLKMMASQVLTVNQVMELLLCFLELGDWKKALTKVVPVRKRAAEGSLEHSGEVQS